MVVASAHNQDRLKDIHLKIGDVLITPKSTVTNFGAILDSSLSMEKQVNSVLKKMHINIRRIAKVKQHLTQDACTKVINATATSHLDYHNALLLGVTNQTCTDYKWLRTM
jgi:hypothetical protein